MANPSRTSLTNSEKRLLISVGLFVALVLGVMYWWQQSNRLPDLAIPTPVMPNPNALDYFVKAGSQLSVVPLSAKYPLEGIHQYLIYKHGGWPNTVYAPTLAEIQALVHANQAGFTTLRLGLQHPCCEPANRTFNFNCPVFRYAHSVAKCLLVEGYVKAVDGDWDGALGSDIDAIQMGEMVPHGGGLTQMLVGISIQNIGREYAWETIDQLNAAQARAGALRLEAISAMHAPYSDVLQEEKWSWLAILLDIFHHPQWWKENEFSSSASGWYSSVYSTSLIFANKRDVLNSYSSYMDALTVNAKLPYAVLQRMPSIPHDPINQRLFHWTEWDFRDLQCRETVSVTKNALLELKLALHAYRLEHGAYPVKITALVPGYLKAIPDDPFALKGPMQYKLKGSSYVLYSVGPDGKDDGGKPSADGQPWKYPQPQPINPLDKNSTGDIVAGVNVR